MGFVAFISSIICFIVLILNLRYNRLGFKYFNWICLSYTIVVSSILISTYFNGVGMLLDALLLSYYIVITIASVCAIMISLTTTEISTKYHTLRELFYSWENVLGGDVVLMRDRRGSVKKIVKVPRAGIFLGEIVNELSKTKSCDPSQVIPLEMYISELDHDTIYKNAQYIRDNHIWELIKNVKESLELLEFLRSPEHYSDYLKNLIVEDKESSGSIKVV